MPEVVVDEDDLTGHRRDKLFPCFRHRRFHQLFRDDSPQRRSKAGEVTSANHFQASAANRRVIEPCPDLQGGIAVEAPEATTVLMPGEITSAGLRTLVEDECTIQRYVRRDEVRAESLKERLPQPCEKERIPLELFHLAVVERRALVASTETEVLVFPGVGITLEEHALVAKLAEHDLIDAYPQLRERFFARKLAHTRKTVFAKIRVDIPEGACALHQA